MVGLANHHSFPHPNWAWAVVGDGHLFRGVCHIDLGDNGALLQEQSSQIAEMGPPLAGPTSIGANYRHLKKGGRNP